MALPLNELIAQVKARVERRADHHTVKFPIPRFIVIGKQSVGKSRLIETLAGDRFNFVSGSLGSRRPTALEFVHNPDQANQWYLWDNDTSTWSPKSINEVQKTVSRKHEELGKHVSHEQVRVKLEGKDCADVSIVDLPGFRAFADDEDARKLGDEIEILNRTFMEDLNNVMLCVEEASDNTGMSTLGKCKALDPKYSRTILIRNKLDKWYPDLSPTNVTAWLSGSGDLPKELRKFALSLPHWGDETVPLREGQFREATMKCSNDDVRTLNEKQAPSALVTEQIGFNTFKTFITRETTRLFRSALPPLMAALNSMILKDEQVLITTKNQLELCDADKLLHATRDAGVTFARGFSFFMEGHVSSRAETRQTLAKELEHYHNSTKLTREDTTLKFFNNDSNKYIEYLVSDTACKHMAGLCNQKMNGGAQFRRLMGEIQVFVRFAGLGEKITQDEISAAMGVGHYGDTSLQAGITKVLGNRLKKQNNPDSVESKTEYVSDRLKTFFISQKEATIEFMLSLGDQNSVDGYMFSKLIPEKAQLIKNNAVMKKRIFDKFDNFVIDRARKFESHWKDYLKSMSSSPFSLLQAQTTSIAKTADELIASFQPTPAFNEVKARVVQQMTGRGTKEGAKRKELDDVLTEGGGKKDIVDASPQQFEKIFKVVDDIFGHVRGNVADQMQLYAESFFLLPMLRTVEGEMFEITFDEAELAQLTQTKNALTETDKATNKAKQDLEWCRHEVEKFMYSSSP